MEKRISFLDFKWFVDKLNIKKSVLDFFKRDKEVSSLEENIDQFSIVVKDLDSMTIEEKVRDFNLLYETVLEFYGDYLLVDNTEASIFVFYNYFFSLVVGNILGLPVPETLSKLNEKVSAGLLSSYGLVGLKKDC